MCNSRPLGSDCVSLQNEELQGRIAQLRVENEELRTMVSDRESSILELQLNNDMLTARLADSGSQVGQDPSEQVNRCMAFLCTFVRTDNPKSHGVRYPGMLIAIILSLLH